MLITSNASITFKGRFSNILSYHLISEILKRLSYFYRLGIGLGLNNDSQVRGRLITGFDYEN